MKEYTISQPYTKKVLDISTAHITNKDNELLRISSEGQTATSLVVYDYAYGYFIAVPDELTAEAYREEGFSEALISILTYAKITGCDYVQLDGDGITYTDLQTFDWDS